MRHFVKLLENLDVLPLVLALAQQPDLWNAYTLRTRTAGSPHLEVDDILLRFQPLDGRSSDHRECVNYQALDRLPQARAHIAGLMARLQGERLGRVMITRVPPGHRIAPHADIGSHPMHYDTIRYYDRFHVVLQAPDASVFRCADEAVHMAAGECWWFDNSLEHEVWNDGDTDRLHLIIDLRTAQSVPL
jgi:hypothetical protein